MRKYRIDMNMTYNLNRFVEAQEFAGVYDFALEEITRGRKRSHWMWYIFPQVKGLGHSYNSQYYGLDGIGEAMAYLEVDVLKARLRVITQALLIHRGKRIEDIMGGIDAAKLRSSMTIFDMVSPNDIYAEVLEAFYGGIRCNRTRNICKV